VSDYNSFRVLETLTLQDASRCDLVNNEINAIAGSINVVCSPMQEPRTGIIRDPSNHHLLALSPSRYYIPAYGIDVVKRTVSRALHDIKGMLQRW
jgi:hypothetical protein